MDTDKEKNKGEENKPGEKKQKISALERLPIFLILLI